MTSVTKNNCPSQKSEGNLVYYAVSTVSAIVAARLILHNRFNRALTLYLKRHEVPILSQRTADVEAIRRTLNGMVDIQKMTPICSFMIVYGPKGVGKTTAVNTALLGKRGVVGATIHSEMNALQIQDHVFNALWPHSIWSWPRSALSPQPRERALKVIKAYRSFGNITVNLNVDVLHSGSAPLNAVRAARELSSLGLHVVVDASESSVHDDAIEDIRARAVRLDYMDWSTVESILLFKEMLQVIKDAEMTDLVKTIVGGSPAKLFELLEIFKYKSKNEEQHFDLESFKESLQGFLARALLEAMERRDALTARDAAWEAVLQEFTQKDKLPTSCLKNLEFSKPAQVLRKHLGSFVPASPAMAVVLKHNLQRADVDKFVRRSEKS